MTKTQSNRLMVRNVLSDLYHRVGIADRDTITLKIELAMNDLGKNEMREIVLDGENVVGRTTPVAMLYDTSRVLIVDINGKKYLRGRDEWISLLEADDTVTLVVERHVVYYPYRWGTESDCIREDATYRTATNRDVDGVFKTLY